MLLLALIALGVPLALSFRDRVDTEVKSQARSQASVVATTAAELLAPPQPNVLDRLVQRSAASVRGRVIVVNARGRLLADSAGAPVGRNYANRPEVRSALRGRSEQISRNSETLGAEILATAVPVLRRGRPTGAVRITQSVDAVQDAVRNSILDVLALAGVVLLLGLVAGALIAQQIARPIRRLDRTASRVAAGDLDATAPVEGSTEQRSLARTFNGMTQRIKRLLRVQQDFVADASHQLRTPLTGVRLRLEGLDDRFHRDPEVGPEVDAALREIDRLALIVDELLVLSRAGEHELPGERLDLAEAARRAVERWQAAAAERRIDLVAATSELAQGWCAGPDLDRSLDTLIENALLYSPTGSTVTLRAAPRQIELCDEGPGLAPGEEEAVFERFSRGSAGQRGPSGTGLGLPIARELTRQWGGDVKLSNRPQGGLRAVIELRETGSE
ncbi:MAG TPA: HAMP domain-containing sensor histidine kinase [Solirubrobacterales bacterium]|nr:HAMP domain-containing sensor histidine kinase [Solirubrobacterales bacterium]